MVRDATDGGDMDMIERIDELQRLIEDAKAVPLSSSAMVNRDEVLELIAGIKQGIPDDIRQARWMMRDREELVARARKEAHRILADAQEQRDRLLARTEIISAAEREGERIVDEATERARRIRGEAEDYADNKLAQFQVLLEKTIATVERGREQLAGGAAAGRPDPTVAVQEVTRLSADAPVSVVD